MALDGAFLHCICEELLPLIGTRIDKIYQPSRDMLVLSFRGKGAVKVLFSASADAARVHITQTVPENPAQPPMFCMLLRKHLSGGKLEDIEQDGLERILRFRIRANNEMGDSVLLTLVCEIMGKFSNVILVNETGRIIDSLRRVDEDVSRVRLVLPGMEYQAPPREDRICMTDCTDAQIIERVSASMPVSLSKAIIRLFEGISPIVAREWEFYVGRGEAVTLPLTDEQMSRLLFIVHQTQELLADAAKRRFTSVRTKEGQLKDFSYMHIAQYGALMVTAEYPTASETLDAFFAQRDLFARMHQRANDLFRFLANASERIGKRVANQKQELIACDSMETDRRRGDLISANLYRIQRGDSVARVEDFYDENCPVVEIPLDVRLTPAQNAQLYYKKYRKACNARKKLTELIAEGEQEQIYIDSVFDALTRTECESDLAQLRLELIEQGYLRENRKNGKPPKPMQPLHFRSSDGFDIFVGRNNKQNDQLTLKFADKTDIWLHTQLVHGAHVILVTEGQTPPDSSVEEAAMLAAYYSKGRESAQVKVDYCPARYVKKPAGARPGMVIYTNYQTAFVTPNAETANKLRIAD
ncbi:MAG: NFACT family protein [Oscillospiraceae bacterium]|nr:NFACT family protein [Oscillospiraceae bacterium]MBR3420221.1 NFACT family protein [Oscillospiraceae bacterium]